MEAYTDIDSARSKIDTDTDWALSKIDKRYTIGYCMLVGRNLVSWGKKKSLQGQVPRPKFKLWPMGFMRCCG